MQKPTGTSYGMRKIAGSETMKTAGRSGYLSKTKYLQLAIYDSSETDKQVEFLLYGFAGKSTSQQSLIQGNIQDLGPLTKVLVEACQQFGIDPWAEKKENNASN